MLTARLFFIFVFAVPAVAVLYSLFFIGFAVAEGLRDKPEETKEQKQKRADRQHVISLVLSVAITAGVTVLFFIGKRTGG